MWFNGFLKLKMSGYPLVAAFTMGLVFAVNVSLADTQDTAERDVESEAQIIQKFTSKDDIESDIVAIDDKRKRQIMFAMGVPLLLFIIITVALGVAMGVFGKDVYVPHMIFAGLSLTLALGHAIVGLVWFWPF